MQQPEKLDPSREVQTQLNAASADLFLNAAAVGIVILHVDGTVLRANPAFGQIFGYPPEELVGRYLDELRSSKCHRADLGRIWWMSS